MLRKSQMMEMICELQDVIEVQGEQIEKLEKKVKKIEKTIK